MTSSSSLARTDAVIRQASSWGTLLVSGPDRASWLNGLITSDVKALGAGQGTWGLLLNRLGKVQSVVWSLSDGERLWLATAPGTLERVQGELDRMLIMEDAELEPPEIEHTWFSLHGPAALDRARELASVAGGASGTLDWTGLGGAALVVPGAAVEKVRASVDPSAWLDDDAWIRLRLERALPEFGVDYSEQDRPHEAGIERRAISWSKGCYLGQEVVCMQDMRGKVKRSARVLRVEAPADVSWDSMEPLLDAAGQPAGTPTSRAYSELAGAWLVMAPLRLEAAEGSLTLSTGPGTRWQASIAQPV
jgi:folate-binding protein YgfZ